MSITERTIQLTAEGKNRLEKELHQLRTTKREEIAERIQQAKHGGDISESGEYEDAKQEQAMLEKKIYELENTLSRAQVITQTNGNTQACVGCTVKIIDEDGEEEIYMLVSSAEANISENKISTESPLGAAIVGKKKGEEVSYNARVGVVKVKIISID
ncbi:transcription elongation factor GreA [Candidatus Chlorohelix sp.]|uniref:transcription elongation factor GreA n=1 Tax=Candidatus Chlorohelix sp. TaxID=3139201 RepID=UPI00304A7674